MLIDPFLRKRVFTWVMALILANSAAAGTGQDALVAAGKRLYLEGRGVSGEPVKAMVQGDVPVSGTQLTCQSCHGRSGMGTIESGKIPPAIAGPLLFSPDIRTRTQRQRPAYTDKTLARAILGGIDAAGHPLDPLMPHFQLNERDLAALTAYLRQLGSALSPGSTETTLRLATLIAGDVDPALARAELDVIETFIAARNRSGPQRLRGGHFPHDIKETYREWSLDVWRVSGAPATWRAQIEAYYRKRPVFALIGGLAAGTWQPVHDFCEAQEMPCMLPDTDLPPADVSGFYSFYYSRGMRLEADIVASALKSRQLDAKVIAIVDGGDARSVAASGELEKIVQQQGGHVQTLDLHRDPSVSLARLSENASAIVLWLNAADIQGLTKDLQGKGPPVFMSASLLGKHQNTLSDSVRSRGWRVQLTALPSDPDPALRRFLAWARVQKVKLQDVPHQALTYFACMAFAEGVKHTGLYLSREYVLDLLNHSSKLNAYIPLYTRGGITPWQRVLSRGGYLIDLSGRAQPVWIVP
ncbi:MAG: ABC transporter substrate-binding protein [Gammaproteobacteria bacterium]|nr:ABC transporter substrate-binding protein [Gammaproteobacteria bacterium]